MGGNDIKTRNISLDIIRIIACFLIVWNHTAGYLYGKASWTNIGVQIFFFMSGYLYAGRMIEKVLPWLKKQFLKIMTPYWVYLCLIIPVIYLLDSDRITIGKIAVALSGAQGLVADYQINSLGQHWFITYILICYLLTPFLGKFMSGITNKRYKVGGGTG